MELSGSRARWVLIEADCWEAAASGCTKLFPAAPIVSKRPNPSKCLCALPPGGMVGTKARARSDFSDSLSFQVLPFSHPATPLHLPPCPPVHLLIYPSIYPSIYSPYLPTLPSSSNTIHIFYTLHTTITHIYKY